VVIATGDSLLVTADSGILKDTLRLEVVVNSCNGDMDVFTDQIEIDFDLPRVKYRATVCAGQPYSGHDFEISGDTLRYAGTHTFKDTLINKTNRACDTIVTLELKVPQRAVKDLYMTVCFAESNLIWGRQPQQTITQPGYYTDTIKGAAESGCDSIYILYVSNTPSVGAEQTAPPVICADDDSFVVKFPPPADTGKVSPTDYSVVFDAYSKNAGFVDFSGIIDDATNDIEVLLPASVYPDRYQFTITFTDSIYDCSSTSIDYTFDVYYPDTIFQQKWDDVIAVRNQYFNGGFEFLRYQWYKNGTAITGATDSYIYINTTLIPGDQYSVLLTRLDGSQMMSCPITAKASNPDITINPTVISANNFVNIYVERDGALVSIWSITGVLIKQVRINAPQQSINAPATEGTYIIEVVTDRGQRKVQPLVVTQ
jgi:hypothetical protein